MPEEAKSVRTWININAQVLRFNYAYFRKIAGVPVMAVVKSNAYGHGLVGTAKILSGFRVFRRDGWFAVDSITEALRLRREGIDRPILVLGYTLPGRYAEAARRGITVTVSNFEALRSLSRVRRKPAFHLKLDTGMHRQGFQPEDMPKLIRILKSYGLKPGGAYSHFAAAENALASRKQYRVFRDALAELVRAGIKAPHIHMSATGGVFLRRAAGCTLVRVGLGLYGYLPSGKKGILHPVAEWKTMIGELKDVAQGERVGYDLTERMPRPTRLAVLPVGYWHGFDRGLSSVGEVLIRGRLAKVLGRVSMDMIAVDVTGIPGVRIGDEVVLIGWQGKKFIGADDMAAKIKTTAYEVLTRMNPLIKKIINK